MDLGDECPRRPGSGGGNRLVVLLALADRELLQAAEGHGMEVEQWQQQSSLAIARRLLVAAMACAVVWSLQQDSAPTAAEFRKVLVKLSGRKMKYHVELTAPSLLAGYFVYLQMIDFLTHSTYNLAELQSVAQHAGPPFDDTA